MSWENKQDWNLVFHNRLTGQTAWDVAKTSQIAFENVFMELAQPFLDQYPDIPLIIVGGCGLNILLNTKLHQELGQSCVFVPPNPNDCGIATGMILNHMKPEKAVDITYAGVPVLDKHTLMSHVEERRGNTFGPLKSWLKTYLKVVLLVLLGVTQNTVLVLWVTEVLSVILLMIT